MEELEIIDVRHLFKDITNKLINMVQDFEITDWESATCYPNWKVKHIVSHLIQTALGRLSHQRDLYHNDNRFSTMIFTKLVKKVHDSNERWKKLFDDISPRLLLDLLFIIENQLAHFLSQQDLNVEAFYAVAWAGEKISKNWFDIAREFTERWHHQQQIREAVGAETIAVKEYLTPVIDTLIRATPFWYKSIKAEINTKIGIIIAGDSGGKWTLTKIDNNWRLAEGLDDKINETIEMNDDTAWRFLTRSISKEKAIDKIIFSNDNEMCKQFFNVKAILMSD